MTEKIFVQSLMVGILKYVNAHTQVMRAAPIPPDSLREGVVPWNPLRPPAHIRVQPMPCPAALTQVGWGPTSSSGRVLGTGFAPLQ